MKLTDAKCRNTNPAEKPFKVADGQGLYLFVQPKGSKLWRMAYRYAGKQKTLALGVFPHVGLADARARRDEAKKALAAGKNPARRRDAQRFQDVAERWLAMQTWDDSHRLRVQRRLERDAYPWIGHKAPDSIDPPEVLAMLRKVEDRGAIEVAKRLRQEVGSVFRLAVAEGLARCIPISAVVKASRKADKMPPITGTRTVRGR